jgi:HSP20 family protein
MARNNQNDDLLMEDELAAAFLDGNDEVSLAEESSDLNAALEPEQEELPSEEGNDGWDTEADDFPGQLAVDVYETTDKLIVKARTAGISRSDLDVSISDNILTISGTLNGGEDENATNWHIQECYWGEFSRTIALPVQIKEEGVEAILKDGVLTISFEKEKAEAPKKITIN